MFFSDILRRAYAAGAMQYTYVAPTNETVTRSLIEDPETAMAPGIGGEDVWRLNDDTDPLKGAFEIGADGNPSGVQVAFD